MDKNNLVTLLVNSQIATIDEIQGCNEDEIKVLEKEFAHSLPALYREFLLTVGYRAGLLFRGTEIFYRNIRGLTQAAKEMLEENQESFHLPEDAFVFSMHQGYEFNYFRFSEGDNPPVYQYIEGHGEPQLVWNSFSLFLLEEVNNTSNHIQKYGK